MKKLKGNMILMSLVYLVLGAVLLAWPMTVLDAICYVVGGLVLLGGVMQLIRYFTAREELFFAPLTLVLGLVCLGLGLFLVLRSDVVQSLLPTVFGLFVIFDSVIRAQNAMELHRCGYPGWWSMLALAGLSVLLGGIMVANPFGTIRTLVMAIGVILCIEGALNLVSILYTGIVVRRFVRDNPAANAAAEILTGQDLNGDGVIGDAPGSGDVIEGTAVERDAE